ncbi:transcriptional regulator, AraC family [Seinonella peptonophila]|uniref:Transcriptional regulator, AraC family n=1 Tax=Seinonella peptonophila TaxID=112248 RepID=A0A1M5A810_9BACL|nr:AraC family transcriptional regulator [Seinonella peptonophila]SHF26297.1 transcriptional regulator, AraC family [Seinonella peptonophila]
MSRYEKEVTEVITYIHHHLDEPLTLPLLARLAGYSPYHFTRIFKKQMGLSPLYYISSLRIERAKKLLLETDFTVRDIGLEIGQQSLGTFTTQFTKRVGVSPATFRKSSQLADGYFKSLQQLKQWDMQNLLSQPTNQVKGTLKATHPFKGLVLIGLFPKPIPEGLPLYGTLLSQLENFCFQNVQPGTYYLFATSVAWEMQIEDFLLPNHTLRYRPVEAIIVEDNQSIPHQEVILRPPQVDDPPILISIPLLMKNFLSGPYALM